MSVLASLDRFVHATRLDILTQHKERQPRNLRWVPLLILLAMPAGYAVLISALHHLLPVPWGAAGGGVFVIAFVAANVIRVFGPRLIPERGQPLDEREQMVKARAGSLSGAAIAMLLALGCCYCGFAAGLGWWMPRTPIEWIFLALIIQGWVLTLPVLVASWLQPKPDREEDQD